MWKFDEFTSTFFFVRLDIMQNRLGLTENLQAIL